MSVRCSQPFQCKRIRSTLARSSSQQLTGFFELRLSAAAAACKRNADRSAGLTEPRSERVIINVLMRLICNILHTVFDVYDQQALGQMYIFKPQLSFIIGLQHSLFYVDPIQLRQNVRLRKHKKKMKDHVAVMSNILTQAASIDYKFNSFSVINAVSSWIYWLKLTYEHFDCMN